LKVPSPNTLPFGQSSGRMQSCRRNTCAEGWSLIPGMPAIT
jgi:hypothetical protein